MNTLKKYSDKPFFRHLLFWLCVFLYFTSSSSLSIWQSLECYLALVGSQIMVAYICIYFWVPKFLNKKKTVLFIVGMVALCIVAYTLHTAYRTYYLDPKYFDLYNQITEDRTKVPFLEKLFDFKAFLSRSILFLTPTALLLMLRFYKNQQKYLKLSEQKKVAELTALKHQLNPHFLFNTLNNLYSLALKKSEKTPDVIERLSDILDYILYKCDDTFVPLQNEIGLIENYLALEKIRYGKRVTITFENAIDQDIKIAPLLLLTFIENAFKHGVTQELHEAIIKISLASQGENIVFSIYNTKPNMNEDKNQKKQTIGLNNIKQQLDLLYPNTYDLQITDMPDSYSAVLKLPQK